MRLFYNQASPYARKVRVFVHEIGIAGRVEMVDCGLLSPIAPNAEVVASNPVGKIPTLIDDDGNAVFDSRVICELLDDQHEGPSRFPANGPARWRALTRQALGDGLLDAALLVRYELLLRPEGKRSTEWVDNQWDKVLRSLDRLEHDATGGGGGVFDIGSITLACALSYLDFRFADEAWRERRPRIAEWFESVAERPSMTATTPQ